MARFKSIHKSLKLLPADFYRQVIPAVSNTLCVTWLVLGSIYRSSMPVTIMMTRNLQLYEQPQGANKLLLGFTNLVAHWAIDHPLMS